MIALHDVCGSGGLVQDLARKKFLPKVNVEHAQSTRSEVVQECRNGFTRDQRALPERTETDSVCLARQVLPVIRPLQEIPRNALGNLVLGLAVGVQRDAE